MRIKITYLFAAFVILSMLASCLSTDKVVSGGWLQKRKFNKGFYFARNGSNTKKKSVPEKEEKDSTVVSVPSKTICIHPALIIPDFSLLTEPVFRSEPIKKSVKSVRSDKRKRKPLTMIGLGMPPLVGFSSISLLFSGFPMKEESAPKSVFNWPALFSFLFGIIALLSSPFEVVASPVFAFIAIAFGIVSWILEAGHTDKWTGVGFSFVGVALSFLALLIFVAVYYL
jgi:hypothetical protein